MYELENLGVVRDSLHNKRDNNDSIFIHLSFCVNSENNMTPKTYLTKAECDKLFDEKFPRVSYIPHDIYNEKLEDKKSFLHQIRQRDLDGIGKWAKNRKRIIEKSVDELGRPKEPTVIMCIAEDKGYNQGLFDLLNRLEELRKGI